MADSVFRSRRFIWERLDDIQRLLSDLKEAIDNMSTENFLRQSEFEQLKYQMAAISESMIELQNRVVILEKHNSTVSWITRQIGTILLVLLAAYFASIWF